MEDILHKLPWIKFIDRSDVTLYSFYRYSLSDISNKHVEGFIGSELYPQILSSIDEMMSISKESFVYHGSEISKTEYSQLEVEEIEKWVGIPFNYIQSIDWRFVPRMKDMPVRRNDGINEFIAHLVDFFRSYYSSSGIEYLITTLEDRLFALVGYLVAQKMGVKVIGLQSNRFNRKGIVFYLNFKEMVYFQQGETLDFDSIKDSYSKPVVNLKEVGELNKKKSSFSISSVLHNFKRLYNLKKFYVQIVKKYPEEKEIIEKWTWFKSFKQLVINNQRQQNIVKYYTSKEDCDKYVLFPLHYVKDATVTVRDPLFQQFEIIRNISRQLPIKVQLYVKPHPHLFGIDQSLKEIKQISELPNVKIIDHNIPAQLLISNALAIITLNSTVGLEAMIQDIPVITIGNDFYCKNPITTNLNSLVNIGSTLLKIIHGQIDNEKYKEIRQEFITLCYNSAIACDWTLKNNTFVIDDKDGKIIAKQISNAFNNGFNTVDEVLSKKFGIEFSQYAGNWIIN